jgi:hypothetical protein
MTTMKRAWIFFAFFMVFTGGIHGADFNQWGQTKTFTAREKIGVFSFGDFGIALHGLFSLPAGEVSSVFESALGGEAALTFRKFPFKDLHLVIVSDYLVYSGKVYNTDKLSVLIPKALARYDVVFQEVPGVFYGTLGFGLAFEWAKTGSDEFTNIDPVFEGGVGYEMNLSQVLTLQCGVNYMLMPEKYSGAAKDGAFLNIYIGVNYEFKNAFEEEKVK